MVLSVLTQNFNLNLDILQCKYAILPRVSDFVSRPVNKSCQDQVLVDSDPARSCLQTLFSTQDQDQGCQDHVRSRTMSGIKSDMFFNGSNATRHN